MRVDRSSRGECVTHCGVESAFPARQERRISQRGPVGWIASSLAPRMLDGASAIGAGNSRFHRHWLGVVSRKDHCEIAPGAVVQTPWRTAHQLVRVCAASKPSCAAGSAAVGVVRWRRNRRGPTQSDARHVIGNHPRHGGTRNLTTPTTITPKHSNAIARGSGTISYVKSYRSSR